MYCLVRQWLANFISIKQDSYWLALQEQSTPETATFGAEFISGRTCIEQIINHRNSIRYLGGPINDISYVFGDNESMINSSTIVPHTKLHMWYNNLVVRNMVACGYISEWTIFDLTSMFPTFWVSIGVIRILLTSCWNQSSITLVMSDS